MSQRTDIKNLKDYLEDKINQIRMHFDEKQSDCSHHMEDQIDSLKEATVVAKASMEERLAGMNEFRDSLKDQNTMFVRKPEFESTLGRLESDIRYLREENAKAQGKADQSQVNIALLFSVLGIFVAVASLLMKFFI